MFHDVRHPNSALSQLTRSQNGPAHHSNSSPIMPETLRSDGHAEIQPEHRPCSVTSEAYCGLAWVAILGHRVRRLN